MTATNRLTHTTGHEKGEGNPFFWRRTLTHTEAWGCVGRRWQRWTSGYTQWPCWRGGEDKALMRTMCSIVVFVVYGYTLALNDVTWQVDMHFYSWQSAWEKHYLQVLQLLVVNKIDVCYILQFCLVFYVTGWWKERQKELQCKFI